MSKQLHKQLRKKFNDDCLKRDNHHCRFCDIAENLDVHHITDRHDMPNGGYTVWNGITLCSKHHWLCEEFHMNGTCKPEYHPNELYVIIKSSYDKAYQESLKLDL